VRRWSWVGHTFRKMGMGLPYTEKMEMGGPYAEKTKKEHNWIGCVLEELLFDH
jgi:hypothetical protein